MKLCRDILELICEFTYFPENQECCEDIYPIPHMYLDEEVSHHKFPHLFVIEGNHWGIKWNEFHCCMPCFCCASNHIIQDKSGKFEFTPTSISINFKWHKDHFFKLDKIILCDKENFLSKFWEKQLNKSKAYFNSIIQQFIIRYLFTSSSYLRDTFS